MYIKSKIIFTGQLNQILLSIFIFFPLAFPLYANSFTDDNWDCQNLNNTWQCTDKTTGAKIYNISPSQYLASKKTGQHIDTKTIAIASTTDVAMTNKTLALRQTTSPSINCETPNYSPLLGNNQLKQSNSTADFITRIEADSAIATDKNKIDFEGDVIITRNEQRLTADSANYNKADELFFAQGNVNISQPGVIFKGSKANYQLNKRQGKLESSSYMLPARPAQGKAKDINFKPGLILMSSPTFSSCPANSQDWVIKSSQMELHTEEGYGEGEDVTLYLKDIPIIYTPYLRFPLNDERSSGFLLPEIGYSSNNGADFSTPYYWNIAPNMDATITPRVLTKRGFMLGTQFRYLGKNQSGKIYGEYLNDQNYDENRDPDEVNVRGSAISENRGALSLQHQAQLAQNWTSQIDYNYVSDNYYIDDFGNNLKDRSETHLLREARVNYQDQYFNFTGRAQGYQELLQDVNTYSRLPQLLFNGYKTFTPSGIPVGAGFSTEAVQFVKNWDYNKNADEGTRYHLRPYLNMPLNRQYGFIKPKISLDMLQYDLNETQTAGVENDANRATPIFSLDSGLFFEKEMELFNTSMTNTLEPRLFYLYVPHKNQNTQAVFDSSLNQFTFNQLFRENRFSGVDRLGDANQLSFALTSRFFDNSNGFERFRASIGQILYFQDREVQLTSATAIETDSSSSIAAELASQFLPHWNTSLSMMFDPYQNRIDTSTYRLQYKADPFHIVNLDYTYKNDGVASENYNQVDVSTYWKIAPKWRGLAHWNYSLYNNFNLETMLGVEYDSCCYAMRLVVSREQAYVSDDADTRIMLQMQFKGLGSIGNVSDGTLRDNIPGFENIMSE